LIWARVGQLAKSNTRNHLFVVHIGRKRWFQVLQEPPFPGTKCAEKTVAGVPKRFRPRALVERVPEEGRAVGGSRSRGFRGRRGSAWVLPLLLLLLRELLAPLL